MSGTLLAVDGDSFAHRAYHALPKSLTRAGGRPAGALVGFANMLLRLWEAEAPESVLVAWDTLETPTYRHEELPAYQSGREFDDALLEQLALLPELVSSFGFAVAKAPGYEADDFLCAAARAWEGPVLVATSDRDAFQLAADRITILQPTRTGSAAGTAGGARPESKTPGRRKRPGGGASELARIGPAEVRERYGVEPEQVPDFVALRGDPSDRIPGARGVGPKKAAEVLREYRTLEAALAAGRFAAEADELRLYRRIATMDAEAPLPQLRATPPTWAAAAEHARELGLGALARRLTDLESSS